eukprot:TRINITY_DN312_c1_g1_i1.p1 TRINITY_DN312_c1_g1~~TRINITY_DN312_c1_g1_i1.p1  ORF type:complete len:584 (-),score=54.90 TRINITY_DN312_c1_g1_i1:62-1813(-)
MGKKTSVAGCCFIFARTLLSLLCLCSLQVLLWSCIVFAYRGKPKSQIKEQLLHVIGDTHGNEAYLVFCLLSTGRFSLEAGNAKAIPLSDDKEHGIAWRDGDKNFEVVVLGDMIDRGSHSVQNLRLLKALSEHPDALGRLTVIMGNHEALLLEHKQQWKKNRSGNGYASDAFSQDDRWAAMAKQPGDQEYELWNWVRQLPLVRIAHGIMMVHGGMSGKVYSDLIALPEMMHENCLAMDEPPTDQDTAESSKQCRKYLEQFVNDKAKEHFAEMATFLLKSKKDGLMIHKEGCIVPLRGIRKCSDVAKAASSNQNAGHQARIELPNSDESVKEAIKRCHEHAECVSVTVESPEDAHSRPVYLLFLDKDKSSFQRTKNTMFAPRNDANKPYATYVKAFSAEEFLEHPSAPKMPTWMEQLLWYRGYSLPSGRKEPYEKRQTAACQEASQVGARLGTVAFVLAHTTQEFITTTCYQDPVNLFLVDTHQEGCEERNECGFNAQHSYEHEHASVAQSLQITIGSRVDSYDYQVVPGVSAQMCIYQNNKRSCGFTALEKNARGNTRVNVKDKSIPFNAGAVYELPLVRTYND